MDVQHRHEAASTTHTGIVGLGFEEDCPFGLVLLSDAD